MKAFARLIERSVILLLLAHIIFNTDSAFGVESSSPDQAVSGPGQGSDLDITLEELKNRFDLFPYDESVRKKLIKTYGAMGEKQLKMRLYDEAAESFENARKLSPDDQTLCVMKGIALYGGRHYDAASVELEKARRNGGDTFPLLFYLGEAYYDSGELEQAIEVWNRAISMEPGSKQLIDRVNKARRELSVESRMDKDFGSVFVISYDEGSGSALADTIMDTLSDAYNRVGYDLTHYPATQIPVILYTKKDFRSVTESPEWSGGIYDGKIRLPIGGTGELTPVLRGVLFHEYTHVVVGELSKGNCPVWLNEGLAEYEGRREFDSPLKALERSAKEGSLIPFADLENSFFAMDRGKAELAYQQSYSMVRFMISTFGFHKVRDVLVNLGKGMATEPAIAGAFSDYRLNFSDIQKEWRGQIQKEYGPE